MVFVLAFWRIFCLAALAVVVIGILLPAKGRRAAAAGPQRGLLQLYGAGLVIAALLHAVWSLQPSLSRGYRQSAGRDRRAYRLHSVNDRSPVTDRRGEPLIINEQQGKFVVRRHLPGHLCAHLLGYHHPRYGQSGIEAAYNDALSSKRRTALSVLGNLGQPGRPAVTALALTLDLRLQTAAARALGDRPGAVVVLEPATGGVLALVSAPSFDPDQISETTFPEWVNDPGRPLLNRALSGLYPPGSSFKPVTAAALLAAGYAPSQRVEVPPGGYIPPGETRPIRDHEATTRSGWEGHGAIDMYDAMAVSANGYFAALGTAVGGERLGQAATAFGLDQAWNLTPADIYADSLRCGAGKGPQAGSSLGVVARDAIGQGTVLATPFHMALVAATVANRGWLVPPRLALDEPVATPRRVCDQAIANTLAELMRRPVTSRRGTARALNDFSCGVAAKTGSAEVANGAAHAWLIGYAPADRPRLAWAVLVEHGGQGSRTALPIARAVLDAAQEAGWLDEKPAAARP